MPNEPKADDFTEELRREGVRGYTTQVCRGCRWEGGLGQLVNGTCPACKGDKHSEQARGLDRLHPGPYRVQHIAEAIRSAHAAGAREAEEKLGRAMAVVNDVLRVNTDIGDCLLCPLEECEAPHDGTYLHAETCPLVAQGFINRDASRVGGKETK